MSVKISRAGNCISIQCSLVPDRWGLHLPAAEIRQTLRLVAEMGNTAEEPLKPCPLCGCGAKGPEHTDEDSADESRHAAIAAWNKRPEAGE